MKESTKAKLKKVGGITAKITTGVLCFGIALAGAYLLTPNRVKTISTKYGEETIEQSDFELFINQLTNDVGMGQDSTTSTYLSAEFENLVLNYTLENQTVENTVTIDGGLDLRLHELSVSGIEFNVNADVDYNGKNLTLAVGHFKEQLYFSLQNLKLKCNSISANEIIMQLAPIFAQYGDFYFDEMVYDFSNLIDEKIGSLGNTLMSSMSGSTSGLSLSTEEVKTATGYKFTLTVSEDIVIDLISDTDFTLQRVEIVKLQTNGLSVSGAINVSFKEYNDFIVPAEDPSYVNIFNYSGLYQKLASLLHEDNQKIGVAFSADLDNVVNNTSTDIAKIEGSVNVDFDALLDLEKYSGYSDEFGNMPTNPLINRDGETQNEEKTTADYVKEIVDKLKFNLQLDLIGQNDVEYANLDLALEGGEAYIRFNEQEVNNEKKSVMKLKIDTTTMNWIMDKIPELVSSLSGDSSTNTLDTLTSFLSDDVAHSIETGDFSFILDMITDLSNDADGINLDLDLSSLGIGDNASVSLDIDNDPNSDTLVLDVSNISFGDYVLGAHVNSEDYAALDLGELTAYQSADFIPDVVDQVSELVDSPKSGFIINGSVLADADSTGIKFYGGAKFDNSEDVKAGYGNMVIEEIKYHADTIWATHLLNVDVTNLDSNVIKSLDAEGNVISTNNQNEALFIYGDPNSDSNVKGKLHLQSVIDIVDIVKTFIGDAKDDPKFTKFLQPITKLLGMSVLGDIIAEKDYLRLASNELLQEVSLINNGQTLKIVVSKTLLGLPDDLSILINFEGGYGSESRRLKSLELIDFAIGENESSKKINLKVELADYNFTNYTDIHGNTRTLNNEIEAHRDEEYMNLDGIKTLIDLGINTTRLNYYRLTADVSLTLLGFDITLDDIDFQIYVDGVHVKVYGKIGHVPLIPIASEDFSLLQTDRSMSAEFSFRTWDDNDPGKPEGDNVGGVFNIVRTTDTPKTKFQNWKFVTVHEMKSYHYRCNGSTFMDNIIQYLLGDLLGFKASIISDIGSSDSSSSETEARDFTQSFTDTGFQSNGLTIKLGLNLDILTGIDALKEAEITITGAATDDGKGGTMNILSSLKANLRIHFAIDINVSLTASVADCALAADVALSKWNANANSAFNTIDTASYPDANYNKPTSPKISEWSWTE